MKNKIKIIVVAHYLLLLVFSLFTTSAAVYAAPSTPPPASQTTVCPKGLEPSTVVDKVGGSATSVDSSCVYGGAKDPASTSHCKTAKDTSTDCSIINKYVNPLIDLLSTITGVVVAMAIVYGGIQYASSSGDSGKVSKAKNTIRSAVIALIAYLLLWSFIQFLIPGGVFH